MEWAQFCSSLRLVLGKRPSQAKELLMFKAPKLLRSPSCWDAVATLISGGSSEVDGNPPLGPVPPVLSGILSCLPASYVITDLTQLRKIKSMERVQGVSITRELLWWWSMRQATVQQLVDLLCHVELYRAAQIVLSCE